MSSDTDAVDTDILSEFGIELESGGEGEGPQIPDDPPNLEDPGGPQQGAQLGSEDEEEVVGGGNPGRGFRIGGARRLGRGVRAGAGNRPNNRQVALRDFIRLIAGNRMHLGENAADNVELVNMLKDLHVVRSDRVEKALLACPRGTFVPGEYAEDAYLDAPIRVESMEFNISAPHMHATCLEALDIQKGEKFLDAGSGSGIVTACGAYLVGKEGVCMGFDIKDDILDYSRSCIQRLNQENTRFALEAAEVEFRSLNIFMPSPYRGYFDKIHVGGTCPEERLPCLIALLKPEGKMTVPIGQDLRLITRKHESRHSQQVLTQVRFSDLQVPSDADIVLSTMEAEQDEHMHVLVPPSTLQEDSKLARSLSSDSGMFSHSVHGRLKRSLTCFFRSQPGGSGDSTMDLTSFSEPDCVLFGSGWTLSAHRAVLKARCEHFRARFDSGMQDANDGELSVPEQFCHDAMAIFLHYIYKDELPEGLAAQRVIEVLHVASYYGVPRLVVLCESLLLEDLKSQDGSDKETAAEYAPSLLKLSYESGLTSLQNAVLHYIVHNYDKVSESDSYAMLSKREVDMIAKESFNMHKRYRELLQELSDSSLIGDNRWGSGRRRS